MKKKGEWFASGPDQVSRVENRAHTRAMVLLRAINEEFGGDDFTFEEMQDSLNDLTDQDREKVMHTTQRVGQRVMHGEGSLKKLVDLNLVEEDGGNYHITALGVEKAEGSDSEEEEGIISGDIESYVD
ncbi:MAG: hypothetical protein Q8P20_05195 [bacterium]|nr:hypothetical protein [bacterium]MDZ4228367.1 hypothetical protein [Candidatus Levybacteria bacterium]